MGESPVGESPVGDSPVGDSPVGDSPAINDIQLLSASGGRCLAAWLSLAESGRVWLSLAESG